MTGIKRFDESTGYFGHIHIRESGDGDYVLHADHIAATDALRDELASTLEELIEHVGDDLNDSMAKRVAELRAELAAS